MSTEIWPLSYVNVRLALFVLFNKSGLTSSRQYSISFDTHCYSHDFAKINHHFLYMMLIIKSKQLNKESLIPSAQNCQHNFPLRMRVSPEVSWLAIQSPK